jgi:uncharacterized protein
MSQLEDRIANDMKDAMRARDTVTRDALRLLLAAIKNAQIPSYVEADGSDPTASAPGHVQLSDDDVEAVVQKQVKQRRDSIAEYTKAGREDLADKERAELTVYERYLPQQASAADIEAAARAVIAETGASSPRDIGKVMPVLTKQFAGRADGRQINEIVRSLLG